MKLLYRTAVFYLTLGLIAGVFYREFTRTIGFEDGKYTQLSVVHTHLLTLGFMMSLIFLIVERLFKLSRKPGQFKAFFALYNIGLLVTVGVMIWHGTLSVLGQESNAMISGIAGLGHILLTAGLVVFVVALGSAVQEANKESGETITTTP